MLRICAVIPARMAAARLPGKVLLPFAGLPMVEHVRRRALMCPDLAQVAVATCDPEIAAAVRGFGGEVIMTSDRHRSGTDRVGEAVRHLSCSHVLVLQGDEPLLLPSDLSMMTDTIRQQAASVQAWNATGPIHSRVELDNPSFVKCLVSRSGRILAFSRMPMADGDDPTTGGSIRKVLGIIAFERETLCQVSALTAAPFEAQASIEQSRLLENDFALQSVSWGAAFPSVNEPADIADVEHVLNHDAMQRALLARVVALHGTEESR